MILVSFSVFCPNFFTKFPIEFGFGGADAKKVEKTEVQKLKERFVEKKQTVQVCASSETQVTI